MTALKRARLATGMSKRQAAEYLRLKYSAYCWLEQMECNIRTMILTMKLWNKCYHDRYRYGGTYRRPW
jgi:transcriptional regulator with XRE-family HTH domain